MITITDYIATNCRDEPGDPLTDETIVEVPLGVLRQWAAREADWAAAEAIMDDDNEENEPDER